MTRGFAFSINIGARVLPSFRTAFGSAEKGMTHLGRRAKLISAETKIALREMRAASAELVGMAAAGGIVFGVGKAIGQGSRVGHEMQMLRNAGLTTKEFAESMHAAFATARALPTTTWEDNLKLIKETRGAFGDLGHALENLTFNQKFGSMMANALKIDPSEASHSVASAVQALEIRGSAMNMVKYQREMSLAYKAMMQTGGRFNPDEMKSFAATGNMSFKGYSERFAFKVLPSLITELGGGDIVGTQATAFRNQIMGRVGVGGQKLTQEWVRLGLVPKAGTGGNMSKMGWSAGSMKGTDLAMADPLKWAETYLLPAMQRAGININDGKAVQMQMSRMFGRETAVRFATMLTDPLQRRRLHKDEAMINGVVEIDQAYKNTLAGDPLAGWGAMKSSLSNLGASIFMPDANGKASPVAEAMVNIAKGINLLADAIQAHPWLKRGIGALLLGAAGGGALRMLGIGLGFALRPIMGLGSGAMWLVRRFMPLRWAMVAARYGTLGLAKDLGGKALSGLARFGGGVAKAAKGLWGFRAASAAARAAGRGGIVSRVRSVGAGIVTRVRAVGASAGVRAAATPIIGPLARGLATAGPVLMRGLMLAIGYLSNPIGWAALAATAVVLIYKYWDSIKGAWNTYIVPFFQSAWTKAKDYVSNINWGDVGLKVINGIAFGLSFAWTKVTTWLKTAWDGITTYIDGIDWSAVGAKVITGVSTGLGFAWTTITKWWDDAWNGLINKVKTMSWSDIGWFIADALTLGLASGIAKGNWYGKIKGALSGAGGAASAAGKSFRDGWADGAAAAAPKTGAPALPGPRPVVGRKPAAGPKLAGKRAAGGPVIGARLYLVGEKGPELFRAPENGKIIPANDTARILDGDQPQARSAHETVRMLYGASRTNAVATTSAAGRGRQAGSTSVVNNNTFNINGATDPHATAREVERTLSRLGQRQRRVLGD